MNYLYIGKLINTHGIKGEVRILSDFKYKEDVFKKGTEFYIGNEKTVRILNTHRVHKNYNMVTFDGINNINEVLQFKGQPVFVDRDTLNLSGYLPDDIIGFDVYVEDKLIGKLDSILKSSAHEIFEVGKILIPNVEAFVKEVDLTNKKIMINNVVGLLDEN